MNLNDFRPVSASNKLSVSIAFVLILVLSASGKAQSRYGKLLPPKELYSTTSTSNTLYVGIDNNLKLGELLNSISDSLVLKTNNGKIIFDSTYIVIPRRKGNLRIEVHTQSGNVVDTVGFLNFKTKPLPRPKLIIGSSSVSDSTYISTRSFIKSDSLAIIISDDIPASRDWVEVKEFSIGYNYGGYFMGENSSSNQITDKMKILVSQKGPGRMFSIKVITQSTTSMLHTNPMFRIFFY